MRPLLIILAGGKGTRLRSVTGEDIPKPMVEVCGKPFLYWLIKHYVLQGFSDIIISTDYKAGVIEYYPWPKNWKLQFKRDGAKYDYTDFYKPWEHVFKNSRRSCWIVNGDTFIPDHLVGVVDLPIIYSCGDVDAGAQYVDTGKIQIQPCSSFYDIGTPEGLERFKEYFKEHPYVKKDTLDAVQQPATLKGGDRRNVYDTRRT